jgi:hypothetical protein
MSRSHTGMRGDPKISEVGRAFLADLLIQGSSDDQLGDVFDVVRAGQRSRKLDTAKRSFLRMWLSRSPASSSYRDQI